MPVLTAGGPALVHFFDFAQLNSVRTLPYVTEWDRRYRDAGLRTIGVQAPRFPFGADPEAVAGGPRAPRGRVPGGDRRRAANSGTTTAARAGPASSSGAWAGRCAGSTSARATTRRPRRRSRRSCASWTRCAGPAGADGAAAAERCPGRRVIAPTPELFPGGSGSGPGPRARTARSSSSTTRRPGPRRRSRGGRDARSSSTASAAEPVAIDGAGLYALAEHDRHGCHSLGLRPSPACGSGRSASPPASLACGYARHRQPTRRRR